MNRRSLISLSAAALSAMIAVPAFAQEASEAEAMPAVTEMVMGAEDAPVEVIEYASYTCPHCANFHGDQLKQIKENYIDTGKVRFVYREVYFDRPGLWASMVARCGNNTERFFAITDELFETQREWLSSGDPAVIAENLRTMGKVAGIDSEELEACMLDAEYAQSLVDWYNANAEADDISSTPSFIIDGEKYSNMSYNDFAEILDEKLGEE